MSGTCSGSACALDSSFVCQLQRAADAALNGTKGIIVVTGCLFILGGKKNKNRHQAEGLDVKHNCSLLLYYWPIAGQKKLIFLAEK